MMINQLSAKLSTLSLLAFVFLFSATSIAQNTIKASDIMRDIKMGKSISYSNVTITGTLDMTYMDEKMPDLPKKRRWYKNGGSNSIEEQIESKISFTNCVFEDDVYAYIHDKASEYTFIANFENDVVFSNCKFKGEALFKYSDFDRNADFSGSEFNRRTTFKYAEFKENVSFADSRFSEDAIFKYAEFKDGVSFNNATFEDSLDIKYVEVRGSFDITNMTVSNHIDAKYSDINGKHFSKN